MESENKDKEGRLSEKSPFLLLIGISGKFGSGKTTLARAIAKSLNCIVASFATRLREVVSLITSVPIENTYSFEDKNRVLDGFDKSIGVLLQQFGTDLRTSNPTVWIVSLFVRLINECIREVVIDDVRFLEEAERIKKEGGFLVRLEGDPGETRETSSRDPNHISETALDHYDQWDLVIMTDDYKGKIDELTRLVVDHITQLLCTRNQQ